MHPCLISLFLGNIVVFFVFYNKPVSLLPESVPGKFVGVHLCQNTLCEEIELQSGDFCMYELPQNAVGDHLVRQYLTNQTKYLNVRKEIVKKVYFDTKKKGDTKWCSVLYTEMDTIDRIFVYFFMGIPLSLIIGIIMYLMIGCLCRCMLYKQNVQTDLVYHV